MLSVNVGTIYTFKLNSGEELVAKVSGYSNSTIQVEKPVSIGPSPQGMALVPSMFTANPDLEVTINMNSVAILATTDDAVAAKYIEATTGLTVPDKKIIMG